VSRGVRAGVDGLELGSWGAVRGATAMRTVSGSSGEKRGGGGVMVGLLR
jgi:hypothetical protein